MNKTIFVDISAKMKIKSYEKGVGLLYASFVINKTSNTMACTTN
nr:hypothetical protein [uncultured Allomuricauda sp.]